MRGPKCLVGQPSTNPEQAQNEWYECSSGRPRKLDAAPRKGDHDRGRTRHHDGVTTARNELHSTRLHIEAIMNAHIQSMRRIFSLNVPEGIRSLRNANTKAADNPLAGNVRSFRKKRGSQWGKSEHVSTRNEGRLTKDPPPVPTLRERSSYEGSDCRCQTKCPARTSSVNKSSR